MNFTYQIGDTVRILMGAPYWEASKVSGIEAAFTVKDMRPEWIGKKAVVVDRNDSGQLEGYTLDIPGEGHVSWFHPKQMKLVKPVKDLLSIRRKARRAGGHVAPGMRKYIYPDYKTQIQLAREKFQKIYSIDVSQIPMGMSIKEFIEGVK